MRLSKLLSNVGDLFRLVPPATEVGVDGRPEDRDDLWRLSEARRDVLVLSNIRTDQQISLAPDHVHSFTSGQPGSTYTGFLEVKVTIDLTPSTASFSIIPSGPARNVSRTSEAPLRTRLRILLNRVNPEILRAAASNRGSVAVMIGADHLGLLDQLRQEPGFDELLAVRPNGNECTGVGNSIGGHIHDRDSLCSLHGVVLVFRRPLDG